MKKVVVIVLMFVFLLVGCGSKPSVDKGVIQDTSMKKNINLYFSDGTMNLVKEQRMVVYKVNESLENRVLDELIKGPATSGFKATVPEVTKVNSVKVNKGTAIVDLSSDFLTGLKGGSEAENLRIYSIVNTLTELSNINEVQFLIDGQKGKMLGQTELDGDFERDATVIKNSY